MKRGLESFFRFDWTLFFAATILTVIGLLAIYGLSISREALDLFQFKKQLVAAVIGLALVLGSAFFDYRHLRSLALPLYLFGVALLGAVLVFGETIRGTRGWFVLGHLSFQPVEVAKVLLAIFLAFYLSKHTHKRIGWTAFLGSVLASGFYVGLVLLQPDFGSAAVMIAIWLAAVLFAGMPRRAWLTLALSLVVVGGLVWKVGLKPYQQARIVSFFNPTYDTRGAGYNVTQARIAIGSGGLFGKGIGEGSQSRLRFLPEASTDFVFSVLGEELGFVGIVFVLGLFGVLLSRYVRIAASIDDPFPQLLLVALVASFAFHLIVNAGMNLGIMPVTGIPLPFVSAAPSSLVVAFVSVALAQAVAVQRQPATFR
ncbi:rod shape-determining protein RodA [Candidatus Uhrbacteria bacterium]|nr:rod shape-determining protein RodA [Candidatus Uhrbacteria bacterium]